MAKAHRSRTHSRIREKAPQGYPEKKPALDLTGVLYDSDVIIEILRGRTGVVAGARKLETSGVSTYCTPVSYAEIFAGIRSGEEPYAEAFFESRTDTGLDARVGRQAGTYLARYARSHGVELGDALIAAAAMTFGLRLWTLNRKHYPMSGIRFYKG